MVSGIHHIAVKVPNFEESLAFYQQGLGLKLVRAWGEGEKRAAMLDSGCGLVELFAGGTEQSAEGRMIHLAFVSSDVDGDYERSLAAGAKPHREPCDFEIKATSGGDLPLRLAFVVAPGGELVEFMQEK